MIVSVQEYDGYFTHTIQVEESVSVYELPCHSKIRKSVMILLIFYYYYYYYYCVGQRKGRCHYVMEKRLKLKSPV